jgi:hypothetical protein
MKINKLFNQFTIAALSAISFVLCLLEFGKKRWYVVKYSSYTGFYFSPKPGVYHATIIDGPVIGTIFFILCCLFLVCFLTIEIIEFAKNKKISLLNTILYSIGVVMGILGLVAALVGDSFIKNNLEMTVWDYYLNEYTQTVFTNRWVLIVLMFTSALIIISSGTALILHIISEKKSAFIENDIN